jgi:hypothetical protein
MIDEDGKRHAKPQPPVIPPHIEEDLSPIQRKALGLSKHAKEAEPAKATKK